jgi:hypothetical protein
MNPGFCRRSLLPGLQNFGAIEGDFKHNDCYNQQQARRRIPNGAKIHFSSGEHFKRILEAVLILGIISLK